MKVEITSKELIKPSTPTPSELTFYKFSYIDQIMTPSYTPLVLYYFKPEATSNDITHSNRSCHLKKSLSDTLVYFYPLAGRMTEDQKFINCSDQGVYYAEARVNSHLSDILRNPNFEELSEFIPFKLTGIEAKEVVEEQLGIQINLFQCGGIVIGLCISHKIADGFSFSTFIRSWTSIAKGDGNIVHPILNSASIFPPTIPAEYCSKQRSAVGRLSSERLVIKRFIFTASTIAALKATVIASSDGIVNPTRVEVVSALIWKCGQAVTGVGKLKDSMAFHMVNIRGRMVPPLAEESFGNIFQIVGTSAVTNEDTDLCYLVGKLRAAFGEIDGEHVKEIVGENSLQVLNDNLRKMGGLIKKGEVEIFTFSSWCRFPCYEADFGWGRPSWVSVVDFLRKNCVLLFDSASGGGMEVWFTMSEDNMIKFEQHLELQLSNILKSSKIEH